MAPIVRNIAFIADYMLPIVGLVLCIVSITGKRKRVFKLIIIILTVIKQIKKEYFFNGKYR